MGDDVRCLRASIILSSLIASWRALRAITAVFVAWACPYDHLCIEVVRFLKFWETLPEIFHEGGKVWIFFVVQKSPRKRVRACPKCTSGSLGHKAVTAVG
jgi:hypothetical protein